MYYNNWGTSIRLAFLIGGWPLAATALLAAVVPAEIAVESGEFRVSPQQADRYRPVETTTITRVREIVVDAPLSLSVAPHGLLDDTGAQSLFDATRYLSGVANSRGSGTWGIQDRQNIRGFEVASRSVDGLWMFPLNNLGNHANFPIEFVDRVEISKGPNPILAPAGSSGGSINVISKSPQREVSHSLSVAVGNYGADKITVDSTGAIWGSQRWSYRAIAAYQDTDVYIPGGLRQWSGSAQVAYKAGVQTKVVVKYFGQDWRLLGAAANPNNNGWMVVDPSTVGGTTIGDTPPASSGFTYNGWNGNTPWSRRTDRLNFATAELTSVLPLDINMRLAGALFYDRLNFDVGFLSTDPASLFDPVTGVANGVRATGLTDPTNATAAANLGTLLNRTAQVQNDFTGNYQWEGISLEPVAGWSYHHGVSPPSESNVAPLPSVDLFAGYYDPLHPDISAYVRNNFTSSEATQYQFYVSSRVGFLNDRILATGTLAHLHVKVSQTNLRNGATLAVSGNKDMYVASVLGKVIRSPGDPLIDEANLYYTYSTNAALTAFNNGPLWLGTRQHEYGLRTVFLNDRLLFRASRFEITQTNSITTNPAFNIDRLNNPRSILTEPKNRGFELELVGGLTKNLSVIAAHTSMKSRDTFGRRLRNVPDSHQSLAVNYRFTDGFLTNASTFIGVLHNGKTAGETVTSFTATGTPNLPGFYVNAWTVLNAGIGYRYERYTFNLNVDNVLNDKFAWQPSSRTSVSPYPGTAVRLTATVIF
jgi:iron complex outermembrane receptor protein